jgi:hypothetical protein
MPRKHKFVIGVALYLPDRASSKRGIVALTSLATCRRLKSISGSYRKNLQIRSGRYGRKRSASLLTIIVWQSNTDAAKSQHKKPASRRVLSSRNAEDIPEHYLFGAKGGNA